MVVALEPIIATPPSPVGSKPEKVPEDFADSQDPVLQLAGSDIKSSLGAVGALTNVEQVSAEISIDRTSPIPPIPSIDQTTKLSIVIDLF
ncbi:MAG: hypothetical protein HQ482_01310 [Sphingomonadales bacterium]|nr:hypothetical protein [Sphingomonadales bacterium]